MKIGSGVGPDLESGVGAGANRDSGELIERRGKNWAGYLAPQRLTRDIIYTPALRAQCLIGKMEELDS